MTGISQLATLPDAPVWRGMSRAELDIAYDNSGAVRDSAELLADWARRSAILRASQPELIDLVYGPRPRNVVDIFPCGRRNAPLLVFIHGGYWQRNSKDVFSCMAQGPLAAGVDVAVPGYTLAPDATLAEIVDEVRTVLRWLRRYGPEMGIATGRLIVSGWSAGGHLAACAMAMPEVDAGLAISGIFDLEPIRLGVLNDKVGLSREDASALSPLLTIPSRAGRLVVACGGAELPELQRQSSEHSAAWTASGLDGALLVLPGRNHFTILEDLASPGGRLAREVAAFAA
ncbi:alpha/beta hydrolase [Mesorhizobium sp. CAU 1741]|uniref:alpha/beta hydrolase n=1 Tax=Mesorhizobium sp. CAU 1741 TaxID=3140366 RepID=UPI00325BF220